MKGEGLPSKENLSVQRPSEKVPRYLEEVERSQRKPREPRREGVGERRLEGKVTHDGRCSKSSELSHFCNLHVQDTVGTP